MQFSITRHGGQYQFWHTDCEKVRDGVMGGPKFLGDDFKQFKCFTCDKVGRVQMKSVTVGAGTLSTEAV